MEAVKIKGGMKRTTMVERERVLIEDALKHFFVWEYRGQTPTAESLAGAISLSLGQAIPVVRKLEDAGLVDLRGGVYRLTEDGRSYALQVLRAHRLYETYLANQTGLRETTWHKEADRREHTLSGGELDELAHLLGDPRYDPHGDPIPTASGQVPPIVGQSLKEKPVGWEGRIVHIEDEPEDLYEQVVRRGLAPGIVLRVVGRDQHRVSLLAEGQAVDISKDAADNIRVSAFAPEESYDASVTRLSSLESSERGLVVGLSPSCRGLERRRLLDMGVVPGTEIDILLPNAGRSPVGYRIRGACIALRREQADKILIRKAAVAVS